MLKIRYATIQDLEKIVNLAAQVRLYHNKILGNYFNELDINFGYRFMTEAIQKTDKFLLVSDDNGLIKGFILGMNENKPWLKKPQTCTISTICVDKSYRQHGIGKLLINEMKKICQKNGVQQLTLDVFCKNTNAIHFYETCGFTPLSIKMDISLTKESENFSED